MKRGTKQFFGLDEDCDEENQCRWLDRRRRLAAKAYGRLKEDPDHPQVRPSLCPSTHRSVTPVTLVPVYPQVSDSCVRAPAGQPAALCPRPWPLPCLRAGLDMHCVTLNIMSFWSSVYFVFLRVRSNFSVWFPSVYDIFDSCCIGIVPMTEMYSIPCSISFWHNYLQYIIVMVIHFHSLFIQYIYPFHLEVRTQVFS